MQVLLVTGGRVSYSNTLDSTEILLPSATSWSYSGALPSPRNMLRGATLDNKVVMIGTNSYTLIFICHSLFYKYYNSLLNAGGQYWDGSTSTFYEDVLEYDVESGVWRTMGTMTLKRSYHAVSVINFNSIQDYCTVIDY